MADRHPEPSFRAVGQLRELGHWSPRRHLNRQRMPDPSVVLRPGTEGALCCEADMRKANLLSNDSACKTVLRPRAFNNLRVNGQSGILIHPVVLSPSAEAP